MSGSALALSVAQKEQLLFELIFEFCTYTKLFQYAGGSLPRMLMRHENSFTFSEG